MQKNLQIFFFYYTKNFPKNRNIFILYYTLYRNRICGYDDVYNITYYNGGRRWLYFSYRDDNGYYYIDPGVLAGNTIGTGRTR